MVKNHLKRLKMPRTWPIPRKTNTWITRQNSGPHRIENSMPVNVVLRDLLGYARTTKEAKKILNDKEVLINKIARKDHRFPVGIFDIIEIPKNKENKIQINLHDGSNFISDKKDYKVNDTLVIDLKTKKILKELKFENGSYAFITSGKYSGSSGEIKSIKDKQI